MIEIIFATGNVHKLKEVQKVFPDNFKLLSLEEIGILEEIPETGDTLEENAEIKAKYIYNKTGMAVFAEDTGLEVYALDMQPGVRTARYASEEKKDVDNMKLLLSNLKEVQDRRARFRTALCYIINDKKYLVEGIIDGKIAHEPSGTDGFGYDPIFIPEGYDKPFAALGREVKYQMSHRTRAIKKLVDLL